jgi:hypothetical protein
MASSLDSFPGCRVLCTGGSEAAPAAAGLASGSSCFTSGQFAARTLATMTRDLAAIYFRDAVSSAPTEAPRCLPFSYSVV